MDFVPFLIGFYSKKVELTPLRIGAKSFQNSVANSRLLEQTPFKGVGGGSRQEFTKFEFPEKNG